MNTGGGASCRESGTLQPKCNYHHQNRRAYFTKKGHGSKIIFNERRRQRRSASDSQNPQPSRPTDPRPATRASAALRSIPNDLTSRNPLANASRTGTLCVPPTAAPPEPTEATPGFSSNRNEIDNSPGRRYSSDQKKRLFKFPIR